MDIKQDNETMANDEVSLYDYWEILVRRKIIFLGIFLVPLIIIIIISLNLPRHYRGESEISLPEPPVSKMPPAITVTDIVSLIGNIDDNKKATIFANNSDAIKSVKISIPGQSVNKLKITIDSKSPDIIPHAIETTIDYIINVPEIQKQLARKKEENDWELKKLMEIKKANLIFLNQTMDLIKKRQLAFMVINPADLIRDDADLSLEIKNLQRKKTTACTLGPPSITKQPTNAKIKQIIIVSGLLSFMAGIFVVLFLDYIERMKARGRK